eukprot:8188461-Pyramimonas_sp.AAC.2
MAEVAHTWLAQDRGHGDSARAEHQRPAGADVRHGKLLHVRDAGANSPAEGMDSPAERMVLPVEGMDSPAELMDSLTVRLYGCIRLCRWYGRRWSWRGRRLAPLYTDCITVVREEVELARSEARSAVH